MNREWMSKIRKEKGTSNKAHELAEIQAWR